MLLIILLSMFSLGLADKRILAVRQYAKTTKVECKANPDLIANVTCKLKPINWEKTVWHFAFDAKQPITNISINAQFFRRETNFVPFLINITKNFCDILDHKRLDFYARFSITLIERFLVSKPPTCPILGHVELKDVYLDTNYLKFILPTGMYRLLVTFYEEYPKRFVGFVNFYGTMGEKPQQHTKF